MVPKRKKAVSFSGKLVLFFMVLLSISSLFIGFTGYYIARNELNKKGEIILKNSVLQALYLIESEHSKVQNGLIPEDESKENLKKILSGPMDPETKTRKLSHKIDLGKNGYFIIYNSEGDEIMHPSLEGQNVLEVKDFGNKEHFLVKEQIKTGKNNGGFVYYSWWLPHKKKIAKKVSYCNYYEPWDWIVVATSYKVDFNKATNIILLVLIITILFLVFLVSIIIIRYIRKITKPIIEIVHGMDMVGKNSFEAVQETPYNDEISLLINGYNNMIVTLQKTKKDLIQKEEYISFLAYHDDLTALPNRHGIEKHVKERIKKGCETAYMVQMDIVGLKIINSTLGYIQGDFLLKLIGSYLTKKQSPDFFLSRTSSNEFTFWIENISHIKIKTQIEKLRTSLKEYLKENGFGQICDMQLAMAVYPAQGTEFGELYEKASMAMKIAKDKNTLIIQEYCEETRKNLEHELSMMRFLKKALRDHEITPYYQAQVDYKTGKTVGVEALARWNSRELGFISPALFIPAIESQNLVTEFSNYMIEKVLSDYDKLKAKYNNDITLSINISPAYFIDTSCYEYLQTVFKEYTIPPEKLTLEITEDVFITDTERINDIILHLHNLGIRISIDDFGTGYSSLNYLTKMDFDEMKIDKSFIDKILEDKKSFQLFEVLCNIAQIYDYDIVAEGVETDLQLEKIKSTSLRTIQGYLFSKPEPLD